MSMSISEAFAVIGLETIFSPAHPLHDRILYDRKEGAYYDRYSDIFLSLDEVKAFGIG